MKRKKKQQGVTEEALEFVKNGYRAIFEKAQVTELEAFQLNANELEGVTIGRNTLRSIFNGNHVHKNTIKAIIIQMGGATCLYNGILSLETEETETPCEQ